MVNVGSNVPIKQGRLGNQINRNFALCILDQYIYPFEELIAVGQCDAIIINRAHTKTVFSGSIVASSNAKIKAFIPAKGRNLLYS